MERRNLSERGLFRFYIAKQILMEATERRADPSPVSRMQVVLLAGHVLELATTTALGELGIPTRGRDNRTLDFPELANRLYGKCEDLSPSREAVGKLWSQRNSVQHEGTIPSPEEALEATIHAEAFLRSVLEKCFGMTLEEVTLSSLVEDEKAREHLQKAEEALRREDYREAATEALLAFEIGWDNFNKAMFRYQTWGRRIIDGLTDSISNAMRKAAQRTRIEAFQTFAKEFDKEFRSPFRNALYKIVDPLELSLLGVELDKFYRFKQVTPFARWVLGRDEPIVHAPPDWSPSKEDALFALDFACNALLQFQEWLKRREEVGEK